MAEAASGSSVTSLVFVTPTVRARKAVPAVSEFAAPGAGAAALLTPISIGGAADAITGNPAIPNAAAVIGTITRMRARGVRERDIETSNTTSGVKASPARISECDLETYQVHTPHVLALTIPLPEFRPVFPLSAY